MHVSLYSSSHSPCATLQRYTYILSAMFPETTAAPTKNKHTHTNFLIWILVRRLHKLVAMVFRLKAHSIGKAAAAQATLAFQYIDCYRCSWSFLFLELNINISKANGTNIHTACKKNTHRIQQRQQHVNVSVKESERRRWMYISSVRLRRLLQIKRIKKGSHHSYTLANNNSKTEWMGKKGKWYTRTIKTKPSHNIESIESKNRETQNKHEIFHHGYCYPTTLLLAFPLQSQWQRQQQTLNKPRICVYIKSPCINTHFESNKYSRACTQLCHVLEKLFLFNENASSYFGSIKYLVW